ncbi:hypothetical protein [Oceanihabitans sediminis]|uniref:hypothetical protein n=1 Tax=Oceanihabitans sediminis TaxID=1812012 RepID=UPI00299DEDD7|nr:hypothetical protein [Oceanihabitans sediminis]MDX1774032.1 hypothetical protein [Oceanihabitans sediminis]
MISNINQEDKLKHPFYKIMEIKYNELQKELQLWTREDLIEWLCWNDSNGVYRDEDSLREFDNVLSKEEAIDIITKQINQE